ncbi:MAG: hypothetical protein JWO30_2368, partial [Fibrobacteres bacterium]|nr:hypothetical protein [Fibrobacterota bacterium]
YMWMTNFNDNTNDYFKWNVSLATGAAYHVWALLNSGAAVPLKLSVEGQTATLDFTTRNIGWDKLDAGVINIPAGTSILKLVRNSTGGGIEIKSLELIRESDRPAYEKRIADFKRYPTWFTGAKYGIMLQYGPWGYPQSGNHKSLDDFTNGFDVNKFVSLMDASGARYVIWSVTWVTYRLIAPIHAVDSIIGAPGYTAKRDLLGEIAAALHKKGIKFCLYYHAGMGQEPAWEAKQKYPTIFHSTGAGDHSTFFNNWSAVVGEIGTRLGANLDGWFFDDACNYYPAPFERLGAAARTGNPDRIVSWNAWVAARYTDFQDAWFAEGNHGEAQVGDPAVGGNGVFTDGPQKGLVGHGMFLVDNSWGITGANEPINTTVTLSQVQGWVGRAGARGRPLSLDIMLWEDGTTSQATMNILTSMKNTYGPVAIRNYTGHVAPVPEAPGTYFLINANGARMSKRGHGPEVGIGFRKSVRSR